MHAQSDFADIKDHLEEGNQDADCPYGTGGGCEEDGLAYLVPRELQSEPSKKHEHYSEKSAARNERQCLKISVHPSIPFPDD